MVYLVRSSRMLKADEKFGEIHRELGKHMRENYPQITEMKTLWNITGAVDGFHIVLGFESLADEEEWAQKIMQDQLYLDWFEASEGVLGPMVDHLYREIPPREE